MCIFHLTFLEQFLTFLHNVVLYDLFHNSEKKKVCTYDFEILLWRHIQYEQRIVYILKRCGHPCKKAHKILWLGTQDTSTLCEEDPGLFSSSFIYSLTHSLRASWHQLSSIGVDGCHWFKLWLPRLSPCDLAFTAVSWPCGCPALWFSDITFLPSVFSLDQLICSSRNYVSWFFVGPCFPLQTFWLQDDDCLINYPPIQLGLHST